LDERREHNIYMTNPSNNLTQSHYDTLEKKCFLKQQGFAFLTQKFGQNRRSAIPIGVWGDFSPMR
jgi:hypothetical protein